MKTTVANILKLIREGRADPRIREAAIGAVRAAEIPFTAYPLVIKTIAEFVKENVGYARDPDRTDQIYPPWQILEEALTTDLGAAVDCEDQACLAASLLESLNLNLPVKVVIVSKTGQLWDHVFLRVGYPPDNPTRWVSVDTTISPPSGREIPYVDQKIYEAY